MWQIPNSEIAKVLATITLTGVAVQQMLQVIDPFVSFLNSKLHARWQNVSDADFKKSLLAACSFAIGLGIAAVIPDVRLLKFLVGGLHETSDFLLTGLIIGTGSEASNTVIKYLGYVKDARKTESDVAINILPTASSVSVNSTLQLLAIVKNTSDTSVAWRVLEGNGGSVSATGMYTSPANPGTYHVTATSVADPRKVDVAVVTVK